MLDGEKEHIKALIWLVKSGFANWSDRAQLENYKGVYPEVYKELEEQP
jgi:hypothetical protein